MEGFMLPEQIPRKHEAELFGFAIPSPESALTGLSFVL